MKSQLRYRWEVVDTTTGEVCVAFSRLPAAAADCAARNAGSADTPDRFAVRERAAEARFGGKEGNRRVGQANGARKARTSKQARAAVAARWARPGAQAAFRAAQEARSAGQRARWERERARAEAHAELLEVAREVGSFLDDLALVDNSLRERGRDLSDRLYSAVSKVKGKITKD